MKTKVLQLCCFTNLWGLGFDVTNIDLKNGVDVLNLPDDYGKDFDIVCAAPPCDQFTLAAAWKWEDSPDNYILLARKCLTICVRSGKSWFLENPPGRIEKLIPELTKYRLLTWTGTITNKQYVIYGNFLIIQAPAQRYGKKKIARSKLKREMWQPDLIQNIKQCL